MGGNIFLIVSGMGLFSVLLQDKHIKYKTPLGE
jgi:hypothetical protein